MSTPAYEKWMTDRTPENMAVVMADLDPVINSEIHRYPGPKPLLRGKARRLAIDAVRSYKPEEGAQLRSWVTTQLQPLSRYSNKLKPLKIPEVAARQAAELHRLDRELSNELGYAPTEGELADHSGLSIKRIKNIRAMARPVVSEGSMQLPGDEDTNMSPAVDTVRNLSGVEDAVYDNLGIRDKQIFDMKTGKHGKRVLSNQEIAARMGVTPALISQRSQYIAQQIQTVNARGTF